MLKISDDLELPLDYVTKTVAILAQRRKGKTYTASVIAEELVEASVPWVALDPTGAWWGLRAGADGSSSRHADGLPVTLLGGEHGDAPLERTSGQIVAELVVDEPGWYVLDLSLFESREAERQFATAFAERLYRRKGQPNSDFAMHLFIDEADMFVPQQSPSGDKRMLGAFEAIVRRGGLRGLGTTLISQRAAVVNKNVLEQIDMLIALRTVGTNDRKAVLDYVTSRGTPEEVAAFRGSISGLDLGEAWVWEPGEDLFERVRIRERRTFNSSATPRAGEQRVEPDRLRVIDLDALKERMEDSIKRAEMDDPVALRRQIADLEHQIASVPAPALVAEPEEVEIVPQAVLDAADLLRDVQEALVESFVFARDAIDQYGGVCTQHEEAVAALRAAIDAVPEPRSTATKPVVVKAPKAEIDRIRTVPVSRPAATAGGLTKAERAVLIALAMYSPGSRTKRQVAILSGYSVKSGHLKNTLSALRQRALIEGGSDGMTITAEGLAVLGPFEALPRGLALRRYWHGQDEHYGQLAKAEALMLRALCDVYPERMTKIELAEAAGYEPTSGHVKNCLSKLRALELIEGGADGMKAGDELWA